MSLDASKPYAEITQVILDAGFFVAPPHSADPFPRICPASKRRDGSGYTGNSFWIALLGNEWFIGAWGGSIYTTPVPDSLGEFAVEWLNHKPTETSADFDDWIVQKYQFSIFDNDEFDRKLANRRADLNPHPAQAGLAPLETWKRLTEITALQFVARSDGDSGWDGIGNGAVDVAQPDANTITFTESGQWVSATGHLLKFNNVYRWSLVKTDQIIRLEHLRFGPSNALYLFDLERQTENTWQSASPHVCRDDLYAATMILTPEQIELRWTITGPKKNETIQYLYR